MNLTAESEIWNSENSQFYQPFWWF